MSSTTLDRIKETDPNMINQVARADVGELAFVVTDWNVRPLSNKGIMNMDGLFLLEGYGTDRANPNAGGLPWKVVVKTAQIPERESAPDNMWYWKREVLWFQSGLWKQMPGPVRGPRCYRVVESGGVWQMWMEYIQGSTPPRWTMDQYRLAARALGRWNGRCFLQGFRPAVSWMSRELWRGPLEWGINVTGWQDYSSPFLQRALSRVDFDRACRVLDDFERYSTVLNELPQVFSHGDYHRRNLMIRTTANEQSEVVAVDWTMQGIGPLGGALYSLIGISGTLYEVEPEELPALEAVVYPEYLAGLHDEGWEGDPNEIRLAYTACLGLWMGAMGPAFITGFTAPENVENIRRQFGCEQEELALGWGKLVHFALDRADEAKRLMEEKWVR